MEFPWKQEGRGLEAPPNQHLLEQAGGGEPGWAGLDYLDAEVINVCTSQLTAQPSAQGLANGVLWPSLLGLITKGKKMLKLGF